MPFSASGTYSMEAVGETPSKVAVVIGARSGATVNDVEVKRLVSAALPGVALEDVLLSVVNPRPQLSSSHVTTVGIEPTTGTSSGEPAVVGLPLVSLFNIRVVGDDVSHLKILFGLLLAIALAGGYIARFWVDRKFGLPWFSSNTKTQERRSVRIDDHRGEERRSLPNAGSIEAEQGDKT
jgi:hypothetical protein